MISTHILDTSLGHPAQNVTVRLESLSGANWKLLASEKTNPDGRITFGVPATPGQYRLTFEIGEYFRNQKIEPFFPVAVVEVHIQNVQRKYHIPLLLNPFGYSTYRGS